MEEFNSIRGIDKRETMCYNSVTLLDGRRTKTLTNEENSEILEYKGHPLRRKENLIYFGSMSDKYIIMLQITDTKKIKDLDVASRVLVQLQLTDPDLKSRDRVVKKSEKNSLYAAMDVGAVWLDRALASM